MRVLLLTFLLLTPALGQTSDLKWVPLKEMTGDIPDHPGLSIKSYAAGIARGDDRVKVLFKVEFPNGAPWDFFRESVQPGFDVSSITRIEGYLTINCKTLTVYPKDREARVFQFNGNSFKSKEPPFKNAVFLTEYFCEKGSAPVVAPKLKPAK